MITIARRDGLDARITADPRFSAAQVQSMRAAAEADPRAQLLGLDSKLRPVIRARLEGPDKTVQYALLRNGDPSKVTQPLAETWRTLTTARRS